ncbi:hypothetical protein FACS1894156_6870 [Bacteroidia bacterium]|nr:hypothetical protein FACS1894156_6870 [Bacteroidia bacterium]
MNKKLLTLLAAAVVLAATQYAAAAVTAAAPGNAAEAGAGTAANPYKIANLANLKWISDNTAQWNKHFIQTADIDASETAIDYDGTGTDNLGFSPIGIDNATPFQGTYNGKGHTISNLYIKRTTTYIGLFGYIFATAAGDTARVDSLGLVNANITGNQYVGGLVGYSDRSKITHSYVTGAVLSTSSDVGGLVGGIIDSKITNSYVRAVVSGSAQVVGGLVGYSRGSSFIANSYSMGAVSGTSGNTGGLVGVNRGATITNSYSTAAVSGTTSVGGLVGATLASTITNSYSTGTVSGTGNNIGGLVGSTSGSSSDNITNSYSTGAVSGTGNYVGGFVGQNTSTLTNNYYDSQMSGREWAVGGNGSSTDGSNPAGVASRTTGELWVRDTFANAAWNFTAAPIDFTIRQRQSYPYFPWQSAPVYVAFRNAATFTIHLLHAADSVVIYNKTQNTTTRLTGAQAAAGNQNVTPLPALSDTLYITTYRYSAALAPSYPVRTAGTVLFCGGDGSPASPFEICNFAQLKYLSENPTYWGINPATGKPYYFVQTADIDAAATATNYDGTGTANLGFSPIGNYSTKFQGSYNGKGHTISNLYISRNSITNNGTSSNPYGPGYHIGLFGYLYASAEGDTARVDSVGLVNVNVRGYQYTGALAGYSKKSKIRNSYVTGTVSGSHTLGGLVGYNNNSSVANSHSMAALSGNLYTGGLVGINDTASIITHSYSTGTVRGGDVTAGLAARNINGSSITNSYSTGAVRGSNSVGGLVAHNQYSSTITNSYSMSAVSGQVATGGLVGANQYSTTITNSYSTGKVTVRGTGNINGFVGVHDNATTLSQNYYDKITTGSGGMGGAGTGLTGLLTPEMWLRDIFAAANWNFTTAPVTWAIRNDSSYAYFPWQSAPAYVEELSVNSLKINLLHAVDSVVIYNKTQDASLKLGIMPAGSHNVASFAAALGDTLYITTHRAGYAPSYPVQDIVLPPFCSGDGSPASPYEICSLEQLRSLSQYPPLWTKHFVQTADIDAAPTGTWNDNAGFSPIGYEGVPFTGSYNGKGHIISNLYINRTSNAYGAGSYIGLFGNLGTLATGDTAQVDSVGLVNVNITGYQYVGGLAGYSFSGKITNSYVTGVVSSTYTNSYIGGLVGYSHSYARVTNSYATATVSGYQYVGGLAGYSGRGKITNSYATGAVSGTNNVGGLVGLNQSSATITNSYATGAASGINNIGGLVGNNQSSSSITNTYSTGAVSGTGSSVGGFTGQNNSSSITNSYSMGKVSSTGTYVGGFAGQHAGTLTNNYYDSITSGRRWGVGASSATTGTNPIGGVTPKTTAQMWLQATYNLWIFGGNPWTIRNDSSYAYFPWQSAPVYIKERTANSLIINLLHAADSVVIYNKTKNTTTRLTGAQAAAGSQTIAPVPALNDALYITTYRYSAGLAPSYPVQDIPPPVFCGGDGSQASPFEICSFEKLKLLSEDSTYWGINPATGTPYYFVQTADIDAAATAIDYDGVGTANLGFKPIGRRFVVGAEATPFQGSYNGKGHTISNLYINRTSNANSGLGAYIGLFGHLNAKAAADTAHVDSLGVVNVNIKGSVYVGALVGRSNKSKITNSYSTGAVWTDDGPAGGLVGRSDNFSTIAKSYSMATVWASWSAGGLVGSNNSSSTITNSYATGAVYGGGSAAGGLVGIHASSAPITNSYAMGAVSGAGNTGGLVGSNTATSTITNSYSTGKVSVTSGNGNYAGGFIGSNSSTNLSKNYYDKTTGGRDNAFGTGVTDATSKMGVKALSTDTMWMRDTFVTAGWDFTNTWNIRNDSSYAYFPWQSAPVYVKSYNPDTRVLTIHLLQAADSVVVYDVNKNRLKKMDGQATPGEKTINLGTAATGEMIYTVTYRYSQGLAPSYPVQAAARLFCGGSGTAADPYQICDFEQLKYLSENTQYWTAANHFVQTANIDAAASRTLNIQGNDTLGFNPIGRYIDNTLTAFAGTYNGKGHSISNLYIKRTASDYGGPGSRVGLFGSLYAPLAADTARVDSVGLVNVNIKGYQYIGGLAGYSQKSKITNSYVTGVVSGTDYVGRL